MGAVTERVAVSPKVSFRIVTYYKRPKGQPGITQEGSVRLSLGDALDWILAEIPEDAITITPDVEGDNDAVTLRIDWAKVPDEIRAGA